MQAIRGGDRGAFDELYIDEELASHDFNIITEPNSPSDGVRVAMIEHSGTPIKLIEFVVIGFATKAVSEGVAECR